ncbi:MAG: galactose mutarotase [Bacteroidetes bacterium]|nr:galactose mutarotase [Bacteroidota bacterium]
MSVKVESFGYMPDGREAKLITIFGHNGISCSICNYGSKLIRLFVPDNKGKLKDIVLGYNSLQDYINGQRYFGSNPGRVSGRISNSSFSLNGKTFDLPKNENGNHLHGGIKGFDSVLWDYEINGEMVSFTYFSPDGEEGYPGNLKTRIDYQWIDGNELLITYHAETDQDTPVCITHHSYFNLSGEDFEKIGHHIIQINADKYLETNKELLPTGVLLSVEGTALDLRKPLELKKGLESTDECITSVGGFDHCYVLENQSNEMKAAALVKDPLSGRKMEVFSTYPCIVFYSGNWCNGLIAGKSGKIAGDKSAFCLEPQLYTNAVNIREFPSNILRANQKYLHKISYKFSTI